MEAYWQDTHLFQLSPDARTAIKTVLDGRPNELPLLRGTCEIKTNRSPLPPRPAASPVRGSTFQRFFKRDAER